MVWLNNTRRKQEYMNTQPYTFRPIGTQEYETIQTIIRSVEWPEHYIRAHTVAAQKFTKDDEGEVYFAEKGNEIVGCISLKHQQINFLTCVYTLVVAKPYHRKGVGKALLNLAEDRARARGNRGVFLDTTDENTQARAFYKAVGFQEAYTMPYYYSDELHGITYLKLFNKKI
jgi:ribosomal protein S18 acetylase RimI-like enzyme